MFCVTFQLYELIEILNPCVVSSCCPSMCSFRNVFFYPCILNMECTLMILVLFFVIS